MARIIPLKGPNRRKEENAQTVFVAVKLRTPIHCDSSSTHESAPFITKLHL